MWFDETRHPAFQLGTWGFLAFPAFVLPLGVTTVYLLSRARNNEHRRRQRQRQRQQPQVAAPVRPVNAAAPPDQWMNQIRSWFCTYQTCYVVRALFDDGKSHRVAFGGYAYLEAVALLDTACRLDPESGMACILTAIGWMLSTKSVGPQEVLTTATALLALPCAFQFLGPWCTQSWLSGVLLLTFSLDELRVPTGILEWKHEHEYWRLIVLSLCLGFGQCFNALYAQLRSKVAIRQMSFQLVFILCQIAALLVPMIVGSMFTSFAGSCIGWRYLLFGVIAEPPSLKFWPATVGSLVYFVVYTARKLLAPTRQLPQTRHALEALLLQQLWFCLDAVGLACSVLAALWFSLLALGEYDKSKYACDPEVSSH